MDNAIRFDDAKMLKNNGAEDAWLSLIHISLTMNFTPWLNFKTSYAYRGEHQRQTYHTPAYVADPKAKRDYPYPVSYTHLPSIATGRRLDSRY